LSAFEKLSLSTTSAISGIERGKDVLVMFELKFKKSHEVALLVI